MYPGPDDPDLGVFVAQMSGRARARGDTTSTGPCSTGAPAGSSATSSWPAAAREGAAAGRRLRPLSRPFRAHRRARAARAARRHRPRPRRPQRGRDPGVAAATRFAVRRASAVIAVLGLPPSRARGEDPGGARQDRGRRLRRRPRAVPGAARAGRGACVRLHRLTDAQRKNVVRLAQAFERLGEGTLTFVGDGPLRAQPGRTCERPRRRPSSRTTRVPEHLARAPCVCQPSLLEPLGQSLLEGMASGRPGRRHTDRRAARVRPRGGRRRSSIRSTSTRSRTACAAPRRCPSRTRRPARPPRLTTSIVQASRVEAILERAARDRRA